MKSLGGYFELELHEGKEYHEKAIALNTGRNAFEYALKAKKYKKVYLPYYTCDVMLQPVKRQGVEYVFYHIDDDFLPVLDKIENDAAIVYNNYFGLNETGIRTVSGKFQNVIIDNSQAFYSKPLPGVDTFYSPRKFFGVPDGGYLYTTGIMTDVRLETDISAERTGQLLARIDSGAEAGYSIFKENEESLSDMEMKNMSLLTRRLLQGIDYDRCAEKRRYNFKVLDSKLKMRNRIHLQFTDGCIPMVYPFLSDKKGLRDHLISKRIYVATYWENVSKFTDESSVEHRLVSNLVPLPLDQRYDINDMIQIIKEVENWAKSE